MELLWEKMHTLMILSKLLAFWNPVIFEVKLINPCLYEKKKKKKKKKKRQRN